MKPEISDWSTLFLAMWVQNGTCSLTGTLRDGDGALQPNIIDRCGAPWPALAEALADARLIDLPLMILCNDGAFVRQLQGKVPPAPTSFEKHWIVFDKAKQQQSGRKGEYIEIGYGGDELQWQCITTLAMWPAPWRAVVAAEMPKVEQTWQRLFQA